MFSTYGNSCLLISKHVAHGPLVYFNMRECTFWLFYSVAGIYLFKDVLEAL